MKSKLGRVVWLGALVLAIAARGRVAYGQNQPASPPAARGSGATGTSGAGSRVVLRVGGQEVTKADMDFLISTLSPQAQAALLAHGMAPVGNEYALLLLLSQRAVADHLDTQPVVQKRLAIDRMKLLAQVEYQHLAEQIQVSPTEVSQYFAAHKNDFDEAEIREILIRKKAADAPSNAPGLSSADARAKFAAISKALDAGTDVQQVAKEFNIPNAVMIDTDTQTVRKGQLLPTLDQAAFDLKAGQVSSPIETAQALVGIQVVSHKQPDVSEVSQEISNILRQQKLEAQVANLQKSANIWMDPNYFTKKATNEPPNLTPSQVKPK